MIDTVYAKANGGNTLYKLSIRTWVNLCKDAMKDVGYALPDECIIPSDSELPEGAYVVSLGSMVPTDFKVWLESYNNGVLLSSTPFLISDLRKVEKGELPRQAQRLEPAMVVVEEPQPVKTRKPRTRK